MFVFDMCRYVGFERYVCFLRVVVSALLANSFLEAVVVPCWFFEDVDVVDGVCNGYS